MELDVKDKKIAYDWDKEIKKKIDGLKDEARKAKNNERQRIINKCNKLLDSEDKPEYWGFMLRYGLDLMEEMTNVFCLTFTRETSSELIDKEIEAKISARKEFKEQKKYQQADRMRQELEEKGIVLEDRKDGTKLR